VRTLKASTLDCRTDADVVHVRQTVRTWATELGFSLVDQTKLVTAASELARNTLRYGGGGTVTLEALENGVRKGLRLVFADEGPGIPDLGRARPHGYTTGGGRGLGLSGSKRLMNEFDIVSAPGQGTRVTVARWR
jgi:serine/threonine-protein kinase RsbT